MNHENFLFHPSSVGKLMTEPRSKSEGPLSIGAKTYIRELVAQAIFGVDFEAGGKEIAKGNACEDDSIALFNFVTGRSLVKNTQRYEDEYFTGEPDLIEPAEINDIKTAWSLASFPLCWEDVNSTQRQLYEYQLRAYMRLVDRGRAGIAYAMVNTPEELYRHENPLLHIVDHIEPHFRITRWMIDRDLAIERAMIEKIKHARDYYQQVVDEFDRTHQPHAADALAAMNAPRQRREAAAAPAPTKTTAPADLPTADALFD